MRLLCNTMLAMVLSIATAKADTIIDANPSWAELNYQQVTVIDEVDAFHTFDAYARGFGVDLHVAVADQWALLLQANSLDECYESWFLTCSSNSDSDSDTSAGWYKKQALGVAWSMPFARRYALETSYRYSHEAFRLHDNVCFIFACTPTSSQSNDAQRDDDLNHHELSVGARAQWGHFQLAFAALHTFGDVEDDELRLENRFLVTSFLNLVLTLQGGDQRKYMAFGVAARW